MPAGTLTLSAPGSAFASCTAARSVQAAAPGAAHVPLPGLASGRSSVELTVNVLACETAGKPTATTAAAISGAQREITVETVQTRQARVKGRDAGGSTPGSSAT